MLPTYPWDWDQQPGNSFFFGAIPPDWRFTARAVPALGPLLFEPLVRYWRCLTWPDADQTESVSFAELAEAKWHGPQQRTRLYGKQKDPNIPAASQKRSVRSHKDTVLIVLNGLRQKQKKSRLQKIGANAKEMKSGLCTIVLLKSRGNTFSCRSLQRLQSNRFLSWTIGMVDSPDCWADPPRRQGIRCV